MVVNFFKSKFKKFLYSYFFYFSKISFKNFTINLFLITITNINRLSFISSYIFNIIFPFSSFEILNSSILNNKIKLKNFN